MKTIIKEFLLKYCDPKPKYSGITAEELARMLEELIAMEHADEDKWAEIHYSGIPFRPDDKPDTIIPKEGVGA